MPKFFCVAPVGGQSSAVVKREPAVLPHAIMQLETGILCDVELTIGRIPCAGRLVVQGKQIVAEGGDYWRERRGKDEMRREEDEIWCHHWKGRREQVSLLKFILIV